MSDRLLVEACSSITETSIFDDELSCMVQMQTGVTFDGVHVPKRSSFCAELNLFYSLFIYLFFLLFNALDKFDAVEQRTD